MSINKIAQVILGTALSVQAGAAFSVPVSAQQTYHFYQGGFDEGAYITGTFIGNDLNSDGQLNGLEGAPSLQLDVNYLSFSFSGNSLVGAFSITPAYGTFGLVYDLNGGPLGDDEDIWGEGIGVWELGIWEGDAIYLAGPGPIGRCGEGVTCASVTMNGISSYSSQLITVNQVPLPASSWLFLSGIIGLTYAGRKSA